MKAALFLSLMVTLLNAGSALAMDSDAPALNRSADEAGVSMRRNEGRDRGRGGDSDRDRDGGFRGQLPGGSYMFSCTGCRVDREELECLCKDTRGRECRAEVDLRACAGIPIANMDGRLTCGL